MRYTIGIHLGKSQLLATRTNRSELLGEAALFPTQCGEAA